MRASGVETKYTTWISRSVIALYLLLESVLITITSHPTWWVVGTFALFFLCLIGAFYHSLDDDSKDVSFGHMRRADTTLVAFAIVVFLISVAVVLVIWATH